jgi:hypothetical protein
MELNAVGSRDIITEPNRYLLDIDLDSNGSLKKKGKGKCQVRH